MVCDNFFAIYEAKYYLDFFNKSSLLLRNNPIYFFLSSRQAKDAVIFFFCFGAQLLNSQLDVPPFWAVFLFPTKQKGQITKITL